MKTLKTLCWTFLLLSVSLVHGQDDPAPNQETNEEDAATELFIQEFYQTLNTVVNDYPNNFKNITLAPFKDESSNFSVSAILPEAEEAYLNQQLDLDFTVKFVYVAKFYEGTDEETAKAYFDNLEYLIMSCPFECCDFVYDNLEGGLGEEEKSTIWIPFDDENASFEDLLIQLRYYKFKDITDDLEFIDTWNVVLNISRM